MWYHLFPFGNSIFPENLHSPGLCGLLAYRSHHWTATIYKYHGDTI